MNTLHDISLHDLVPSSIAGDVNIYALIEALDPELKLIAGDIEQEKIYSRIDELDEELLNYLAWQLHVDFYDLAGTIESKRSQVKDSILWHMKKGTAWAIVKALDMIGADAEFINWYEYGGKPYTFRIKAVVRHDYYKYGDKEKLTENIARAINESKSARSLLDKLDTRIIERAEQILYSGTAQGISGQSEIKLNLPDDQSGQDLTLGNAQGQSGNILAGTSRPTGSEDEIKVAISGVYNHSISLGVDLDTMQELLAAFEQRIFSRLDAHEKFIMNEIDMRHNEINLQLESILDLLKWDEKESDA